MTNISNHLLIVVNISAFTNTLLKSRLVTVSYCSFIIIAIELFGNAYFKGVLVKLHVLF